MSDTPNRLPRRPRTRRGWILTLLSGGAALAGGGVALLYLFVWGTSSPPPLAVSGSSVKGTTTTQSSSAGAGHVAGTWTVAGGSVAGYRVRETLAFLSAPTDAVGRTSSIKGSATLADTGGGTHALTAASLTVDVSTLTSDKPMRDRRIHTVGLQSDRYPTTTFVLTSPVAVPAAATSGATVRLPATGNLTIHGTTRTVTIPLDVRLAGSQIEVVGSITFPWSEFGMQAPSIAGFVSVTGQATMEFDLHLQRS